VPFHVDVSCSGPFTRCLLRITDGFHCFILLLIINYWHSLEIFHINDFCSFNWKQLDGELALPNSQIPTIMTFWSSQLVSVWKTDIFSFNDKLQRKYLIFWGSFYFKINLCEIHFLASKYPCSSGVLSSLITVSSTRDQQYHFVHV